jgi:hypothetical protein
MSGLFGRKSKPKPVDPQMEANLAEQEAEVEAQKIAEAKKLQAKKLAGTSGAGLPSLMAPGVTPGSQGNVTPATTLGNNPVYNSQ